MCGAPGGFSRPSRLLKHLFSSHISLRTRSSKLAPADALRVAGCSSRIVIERFPSRPHPPPSCPPMLMLALRPVGAAPISIGGGEAASGSGSITAVPNNAATLLPSRHTPAKMARGVQSDGQEQTDTWPCDFSVILESILSNFAICPGGSDGSAELICRLLALLRLYRTSFWSGMPARWCSPVELRGAAVHGAGSRRSITVYLESDVRKAAQTEGNGPAASFPLPQVLKRHNLVSDFSLAV